MFIRDRFSNFFLSNRTSKVVAVEGVTTLVYYEVIKREVNRRLIYECRCDERLKVKVEGSTRLTYTGFRGNDSQFLEI